MPRSVQICIGGGPDQLNLKYQDLSKICILVGWWEWGWGGGFGPDKLNQKCQDLSKSAFEGAVWSRPTQPKMLRSVQICILGGGGVIQANSTQSAKICPNLHFGGWCGPDKLKPRVPRSVQICMWGGGGGGVLIQTNSTQSAKICPNLHFGRGWCDPDQLNPKCQDLCKSAFRGMVWSRQTETKSAKICPNLHGGWLSRPNQPKVPRSVQIYIWGGGGGSPTNSTQSAKICPNLHFGRGWCDPDQLNPKCQDLCKSAFWGMVWSRQTETKSAKICPNLHGGWLSRPNQPKVPRSVQICIGGRVVQTY